MKKSINISQDKGFTAKMQLCFDNEIVKGLYYINTPEFIKNNINIFGLPVSFDKDAGLINKRGRIIFYTIIKRKGQQIAIIQYAISDTINKTDILNSDSEVIEGFKSDLIHLVDLAKAVTQEEIEKMNLEELFK